MKNQLLFRMFLVALLFSRAQAVDGIAVSQASRWMDPPDLAKCPEMAMHVGSDDVQIPGKIIRAIITDTKVASFDTIWSSSLAKSPAINMSGTMIAMFRYEARIVNGILVDADKPRHISVMDVNGQNMRDLVTIPKPPSGTQFNDGREYLDWASGDWIYYSAPGLTQNFTPAKIYRVKASDPSTNQLVYTYFPNSEGHMDRWTISADGTRAAITASWKNFSYTNIVTENPPINNPMPKVFNGTYPGFGSCNGAISPSGLLVGSFIDGGHTTVYLNNVDNVDVTKLSGDYAGASCSQMSQWAGESVGTGMGYLRWSANSDKWYSIMPAGCRAACCGGNQVLVNQYDHQAIMITHNPYFGTPPWGTTVPIEFSTAGDFWVKGPAGSEGKYEDTLGNWVGTGTAIEYSSSNKALANSGGRLIRSWQVDESGLTFVAHIDNSFRLELLDVKGRTVYRCGFAKKAIFVSRLLIPRGVIVARVTSGGSRQTETIRLNVE